MCTPAKIIGPPKRILVATDLSPRCDRALDRAAALAQQWGSELIVLHVLERFFDPALDESRLPSWRRPRNPSELARKHLLGDVGALGGKASILIEDGDPAECITRVAEQTGCELIVLGTAKNELFGRFILGGTVDKVLRLHGAPLLVVKNRPRGPYERIVVATDFSDPSRRALEVAAGLFPEQQLTIFHAYDPPFQGLLADPDAARADYRKVMARECDELLRTSVPPTQRRPDVLVEYGSPTLLLHDLVRDGGVDLIVLGSRGRSALAEILLGSVAKAIMDEVPCDALVIRAPATLTSDSVAKG